MKQKLAVEYIWWRNVRLGEFYNIERYGRISGAGGSSGGGSLYIEIPGSMVPDTLTFLGHEHQNVDTLSPIEITARVIGHPEIKGILTFQTKSGGRMRISSQNRQMPSSQRHPAWTETYGFPKAPDDVRNRHEAEPYYPEGGLRIYLVRTVDGLYYAGFTKGPRPKDLNPNSPYWDLCPTKNLPGGLIRGK
ncbi:MAG: hypothetical protein IKG18_02875 [Atopobiaceae bacterium]|nr:hypothetical protein [Atopobiaceae bacterium]